MVDITPRPAAGKQIVQAYGGGGFRISGQRHEGAVLVLPDLTLAWPLEDLATLRAADLEPLRRALPPVELLIVGTGSRLARLPAAAVAALAEWRIGLEAMDTGAACRTYNVLLLEDRRVAAALLPVD